MDKQNQADENGTYTPRRGQRRRTKGWKAPICGCGCGKPARYVGRPTRWGNPYTVKRIRKHHWVVERDSTTISRHTDRENAYRDAAQRLLLLLDYHRAPWTAEEISAELAGHDLLCWCPLDMPCHGNVLINIANQKDDNQ